MARVRVDRGRIVALAVAGEVAELVNELARTLEAGLWDELFALLSELPVNSRVAMYRRMTEGEEYRLLNQRIETARAAHARIAPTDVLQDYVAASLPAGVPGDILDELLDRAGQRWSLWPTERQQFVELARAWLDGGTELPPAVVGVIRRTALETPIDTCQALHELAAELAEPPVSPGERWADAVLAELPGLGEKWRALVGHAGTATSGKKPSARWEKRGRQLLDDIGPEVAAERVARWLKLVGHRSTPLWIRELWRYEYDRYDPYNVIVLRGLVWLIGFTPGNPDHARTLGTVMEAALRRVSRRGPVSPKIASAAVYALSRMEDPEALAQLSRLAAGLTYEPTSKEVKTALDQRSTAR